MVSGHWTLWATIVVADTLDQALDFASGQLKYQNAVAVAVAAAVLGPDSQHWVMQHDTCVEAKRFGAAALASPPHRV